MWSLQTSLAGLLALAFFFGTTVALADGTPDKPLEQHGTASYYSDRFDHRETASGTEYRKNRMTAASRSLPLGTKAKVIDKRTGKRVEVRVTDRGPYSHGRIIDLSKKAARKLGIKKDGVAPVLVEAKPSAQPTPTLRRKVEAVANRQAHAAQK